MTQGRATSALGFVSVRLVKQEPEAIKSKGGGKDSDMGRNAVYPYGNVQQKVLFDLGFGRDYDASIFGEPTVEGR